MRQQEKKKEEEVERVKDSSIKGHSSRNKGTKRLDSYPSEEANVLLAADDAVDGGNTGFGTLGSCSDICGGGAQAAQMQVPRLHT